MKYFLRLTGHFWRLTGAVAIAGSLLLILLVVNAKLVALQESYRPREQTSGLWSAGAMSNRSANDTWIEHNAFDRRVGAIYRDYDGDGVVDEYLMFSGPHITVFRASKNDGLLDTMRDIREPLDSAVRRPQGSPEAGPFIRAELDENARTHPVHPPSDDAHSARE